MSDVQVGALLHRKKPCDECPWRKDVAPGKFPRERYEQLADTCGTQGNEAGINAPMFGCHKSSKDNVIACGGWLAAVGYEHLGIRIALSYGRLDPAMLEPGEDWPELWESLDEVREHMGGDDWSNVEIIPEADEVEDEPSTPNDHHNKEE